MVSRVCFFENLNVLGVGPRKVCTFRGIDGIQQNAIFNTVPRLKTHFSLTRTAASDSKIFNFSRFVYPTNNGYFSLSNTIEVGCFVATWLILYDPKMA